MRILPALLLVVQAAAANATVFGLEFTTTGLVCSASLPNGSAVGLKKVDGGADYTAAMFRMFSEARAGGRTPRPLLQRDEESRGSSWSWTWLGFPLATAAAAASFPKKSEDAAAVLGTVVARAKEDCVRTLFEQYAIQVSEKRPSAVVVGPTFLFTPVKCKMEGKIWLDSWIVQQRKRVGPTKAERGVWQKKQEKIFLRAVEVGGFKLGRHEILPAAASSATMERGGVVLVAQLQAHGLTLWSDRDPVQVWSTFSPARQWEETPRLHFPRLLEQANGSITVLPIGGGWVPPRLRRLRTIVQELRPGATILMDVEPLYAASVGAAMMA
ncbi:Hypothetical predicted protein [Lecanosticta acicola]|uniref:Uncharacterized protein n=1 Tax=Lecanosticta acicola TaxID=111012 RepID=A0AAI8YXY5_9PEZI|nr:Hypothetical predicted protein [Lecanosticta acicola]